MRRRGIITLTVLALVVAACGGDDDDATSDTTTEEPPATVDDGTTTEPAAEQLADTGRVTLLSAGEPEETDAYQVIFDELINAETEYTVEVVSAGDFEQQFQIQAEGGTLDVAAVPQPGAIPDLAEQGLIVSLEDLGFDID